MKSPAETNLTEIGIIKMPGMEMIGKMVTPINPYDDWEDQRWDDDDDDEEYETATAAVLSEAYAAGWKAKAQALGYRQARRYKQQTTQRRQRGVDKRSTETR